MNQNVDMENGINKLMVHVSPENDQ